MAAGAAGLCLLATVAGPAHGLFQRLGLTIGDAWIVATAVVLLRSGQLVDPADVVDRATPADERAS